MLSCSVFTCLQGCLHHWPRQEAEAVTVSHILLLHGTCLLWPLCTELASAADISAALHLNVHHLLPFVSSLCVHLLRLRKALVIPCTCAA